MLDNASYNKIKLLHELATLEWFLQKHALADAQAAGDAECYQLLLTMQKDIQKYLEKLRSIICAVSQ